MVDYGMGNLYSVVRACHHVGLSTTVTSRPEDVASAAAVILPGVGAFRDAIKTLDNTGLADALRCVVAENRPLLGICLGFQLLMTESHEFGIHRGLDIVAGSVERLTGSNGGGRLNKVPQVGWNRVHAPAPEAWQNTLLDGVPDGELFYFVHSYCVRTDSPEDALSYTVYGDDRFCSTLQVGAVFGCQYHPELSGRAGLDIYCNFAMQVPLGPALTRG